MRDAYHGGWDHRHAHPDDQAERRFGGRHGHGHEHGHRHGGGFGHGHRRGGRPFDYGELRLLALAMIAEQPRHGYELMKAIEERMAGSYAPSPGVIYPTLAWLEDMGYAAVEPDEDGGSRKRYRVTAEGEAFLAQNAEALAELQARIGGVPEGGGPGEVPAPVLRAMENLKLALRLRLRGAKLPQAVAETIAAALDAAAQAVERS